MPYHQAAALWQQVSLGAVNVSATELWEAVQTAGKKAGRRAQELREAVFERGEAFQGTRQSEQLCIEADEVMVSGRGKKGERKKIALKVAVSYEGKEQVGPQRRKLRHRRVKVGVKPAKVFWEETVAEQAAEWDLASVKEYFVGGDGAEWVKQGCGYYPGAHYRLDRFHLRKALLEGLAHDEAGYKAVSEALSRGDREGVHKALWEAQKRHTGAARRRIQRLEGYLMGNWEGIQGSEEAQRLGSIEGQVFHHVARRMKRHGARWSERGADHLAQLLAAAANGELRKVVKQSWLTQPQKLRCAAGDTLVRTAGKEDPAEWLRASLPALRTAAAGDALREALRFMRDGWLMTVTHVRPALETYRSLTRPNRGL